MTSLTELSRGIALLFSGLGIVIDPTLLDVLTALVFLVLGAIHLVEAWRKR